MAQSSYDDGYFSVTIPFPLQLFGQSSSNLYVGVNGWVSLTNYPKGSYVNTQLPASALPDTCFVNYWSDLYVYSGTQQGIYYQIDGAVGSRTASFEWYTSTYGNSNGYYHFVSTFYEDNPGAVTYDFFRLTPQIPSTDTAFGTVGVQRYGTSQSAQYSFDNNLPVHQNMQVVYNPASNSFTASGCSA